VGGGFPGQQSHGVLATDTAVPTAAGNRHYEETGAPGVTVVDKSRCCDLAVPDQNEASAAVTRLYRNHPHPFSPRTWIRFSLAADGPATLLRTRR
jgi:hypothetical protein